MIAGGVFQSTLSMVDMFFVGKLGPAAIGAVGMSATILFVLGTVFMGVATATTALVARAVGAKDQKGASLIAGQSLLLTLLLSILLGIAGFTFAGDLLGLLGARGELLEVGSGYLQITLLGIFGMFSAFTAGAILRGAGDAVTPLLIGIAATTLNIILDPLLIFGLFGFPRMEVRGSALATVIAQFAAFLLGAFVLFGGKTRIRVSLKGLKPNTAIIWKMIAIGLPSSIQMSLRALMGVVLMSIVAGFGTAIIAAYTVGLRLLMVGRLPAFGFADAAATLVGQNLGAGKPARAQKSAFLSMAIALIIAGGFGIIVFAFAPWIIAFFNGDEAVVTAGARFLRITTIGFVLSAIGIVLGRALNGAGDTVTPMVITLVTLWGLQVPLAFFLSRSPGLAESGIWWTMVMASALHASLIGFWFARGKWKNRIL